MARQHERLELKTELCPLVLSSTSLPSPEQTHGRDFEATLSCKRDASMAESELQAPLIFVQSGVNTELQCALYLYNSAMTRDAMAHLPPSDNAPLSD